MDFRVLGAVGLVVAGSEVRLRPMQQAVLGVLLATPRQAYRSDILADRVWNGAPPKTATTALRVYVDQLRQVMRPEGVTRLVTTPQGYQIVPQDGELDAHRFDHAIRRGQVIAETDPARARDVLRAALLEWRGTPFDGFDELAEIEPVRQYYERRLEELRLALARIELSLGRHAEILAELVSWRAARPEVEGYVSALVVAQYRTGDQLGALATCRAYRTLLSQDYGLDVSSTIRHLETSCLRRSPDLDWHPPHRPGMSEPAAAPRSRGAEVRQILALLQDRTRQHLVAVRGPAGIGKSWLLAELAGCVPRSLTAGSRGRRTVVAELERSLGVVASRADTHVRPGGDLVRERAARLADALEHQQIQLVCVDDADDLDEDSVSVLRRLIDFDLARPVWVTAHASPAENSLLLTPTAWERTTSVDLEGLGTADVARLFADHGVVTVDESADLSEILSLTGGNAFLVSALARHRSVGGPMSELPRQVIPYARHLLDLLDPRARSAVEIASVEHGQWPLEVAALAETVGGDPASLGLALESALGLGILTEAPDGLRFHHGFVPLAITQTWTRSRRRRAHLDLALALQHTGSTDTARIAHHLRAADDPGHLHETAAMTACEADQLARDGQPVASATRWREAVSWGGRAGVPAADVVAWQLHLAETLGVLGCVQEAMAVATSAARTAADIGQVTAFAEAAVLSAGPWRPTGPERDRAEALIMAARRWLPTTPSPLRTRLNEAAARTVVVGHHDDTLPGDTLPGDTLPGDTLTEIHRELTQVVDARSDPRSTVLASLGLRMLSWRTGWSPARRLAFTRQTARLAATVAEDSTALELSRLVVTDALEAADEADFRTALTEYQTAARASGETLHLWWSQQLMMTSLRLRGEDLAGGAELSVKLGRHVDPSLVALIGLERQLTELFRQGQFGAIAYALEQSGPIEGGSASTVRLAELAAAARTGRAVDPAELAAEIERITVGPFAATDAALAVVALGPRDPAGLSDRLVHLLNPARGGLCVLSGASVLGAVDTYLARAHLLSGSADRARMSAQAGEAITRRIAPAWLGVAVSVEKENWP